MAENTPDDLSQILLKEDKEEMTERSPDIMHQEWLKARNEKLQELADELDMMQKRVNISQITGTSASIVSGIGSTVCFGLAFATAGISIIPGVVFASIGGAGAATSIGATLGKHFHQKDLLKQVQACLDNDRRNSTRLNAALASTSDTNVSKLTRRGISGLRFLARGIDFGADAVGVVNSGARATARTVSKVAGTVVFAFDILLLPLDIYILVDTSIKKHKGSTHKTAAQIREIASKLENERNEFMGEIVGQFTPD
ncbi:uncharacterized protein LOC117326081 [Pecten maximus]|uniref:uncharacterized protein LOC117326081 n=1 Tax=Pecten maximus TaxID=6579 RepID=UPI001458C965|nr:uncharacterized protein LOC117326081 [Pecten maximus]